VIPVTEGYNALVNKFNIDTIILVDGGTDSLMFGNEVSLGTPTEDMTSIRSVYDVQNVEKKLLVAIGFGVDHYHGVCHSLFLENVSQIIRQDGYLGCFSMLKDMPEYEKSKRAAEHAFSKMQISIVASSINSSIDGNFGNYHSTPRTEGSTLFINPLMSLYWAFKLETVAKNILCIDMLKDTNFSSQVKKQINTYRSQIKSEIRPYVDFPH